MKKNTHGGARRGAGRKQGQMSRQNLSLIQTAKKAALDGDVTPVDVLLQQMRWYHHQGEKVLKEIEGTVVNIEDEDEREKFLREVRKLFQFRELAAARATDVAPYIHPRIQAVHVSTEKGDGTFKLERIERIVLDASVLKYAEQKTTAKARNGKRSTADSEA